MLLIIFSAKLELRQVKFENLNVSGLNFMEVISFMCPQLTKINVSFDLWPMETIFTPPCEIKKILASDPLPNVRIN